MARKKTPTEVLSAFADEWGEEDRAWFLRRLLGKLTDSEKTEFLIRLSHVIKNGLWFAWINGEPLDRYLFVKSLNCGCEHSYEWLLSVDEQHYLQEQDKAKRERIKDKEAEREANSRTHGADF